MNEQKLLHTHREIERAAIERVSSGFKARLIAKDSLINALERKARYTFIIFLSSHNSIRILPIFSSSSRFFESCAIMFFLFFFFFLRANKQRASVFAMIGTFAFSFLLIFPAFNSVGKVQSLQSRLLFAEKSWRGAPRCLGRRRFKKPSVRTDWTRLPSENTSGPSKIGWERKTWGLATWSDGLTVRIHIWLFNLRYYPHSSSSFHRLATCNLWTCVTLVWNVKDV